VVATTWIGSSDVTGRSPRVACCGWQAVTDSRSAPSASGNHRLPAAESGEVEGAEKVRKGLRLRWLQN